MNALIVISYLVCCALLLFIALALVASGKRVPLSEIKPPGPLPKAPPRLKALRTVELKSALKAVDTFLNSNDTWVTDKDGNKIKGGLIACKPGAMTVRFVEKMKPNAKG